MIYNYNYIFLHKTFLMVLHADSYTVGYCDYIQAMQVAGNCFTSLYIVWSIIWLVCIKCLYIVVLHCITVSKLEKNEILKSCLAVL